MVDIHPNLKLLTSTSIPILHGCPRRYELTKLMPKEREVGYVEEDEHLIFGDVVGVGVQEYLVTGSIERAYFILFLTWNKLLDDDSGERSRKTFWHALHALDKFVEFRHTALSGFELAYFDDKPAVELGYIIDCENGFGYRSYIDAVLINKLRSELCVYEGKTSRSKVLHEAMYKHSGQGLGYNLIIDTIAKRLELLSASSFKVRYAIYKTFGYEWELMPFVKTFTQKALWIKNLLLDIDEIKRYSEDNYFPMRGEYCYAYARPCPHFGICELSNKYLIGDNIPVNVEDPKGRPVHFRYKLSEIIDAQLAMQVGSGVAE